MHHQHRALQCPYNVTYRQGTNDPFEKPYRGSPALTFIGTEDHPDLRISETGSSGEQAYLASLNASIFPSFPAGVQRARISQIDVYSPPIIVTAGQRQRYGIATIRVIAGVYEQARNGDGGIRIATRMAKAVLNELPIPGPLGPLQSNINIDFGGNFTVHWGKVTSTHDMILPNNLDQMVPSSVPWYNRSRIIAQDMNLDGSLQTSRTTPYPRRHQQRRHAGFRHLDRLRERRGSLAAVLGRGGHPRRFTRVLGVTIASPRPGTRPAVSGAGPTTTATSSRT